MNRRLLSLEMLYTEGKKNEESKVRSEVLRSRL